MGRYKAQKCGKRDNKQRKTTEQAFIPIRWFSFRLAEKKGFELFGNRLVEPVSE